MFWQNIFRDNEYNAPGSYFDTYQAFLCCETAIKTYIKLPTPPPTYLQHILDWFLKITS